MKLRSIVLAAALAVTGASASATTTNLGAALVGVPLSFGGFATVGNFSDIFTFSLPTNGGSGYAVSNFMALPAQYNTVLSTLSLVSNPDGILFNLDDALVSSTVVPGGNSLSMAVGAVASGNYYLNVTGLSNGTTGGIYNGAISVSAIPEPETYALMLAGLGIIGFIGARRRDRR